MVMFNIAEGVFSKDAIYDDYCILQFKGQVTGNGTFYGALITFCEKNHTEWQQNSNGNVDLKVKNVN